MKYKLVIAHRVCPKLAEVAALYDDKFLMVKDAAMSLAASLSGIRTKLVVILDGCDDTYRELFDSIFGNGKVRGVDYEVLRTPAIGNHSTYACQLDVLMSYINQGEYFYFSEDDYIYVNEAFHAMIDFLNKAGVDFITPLDHPDRYSSSIPESQRVAIRVSKYCHWREVGTTCCTFMTSQNVFKETLRQLSCYGKGGCDGTLWLGLTKDGVFNIVRTLWELIRYVVNGRRDWSKCIVVSAWKYHHFHLLTSPKYHLWGPMPSLAVHLAKPSLPPFTERLLEMVSSKD
jgi:hypothetical protein